MIKSFKQEQKVKENKKVSLNKNNMENIIYKDDVQKKKELDKEIRTGINKEFFELLKKDVQSFTDDDKQSIINFINNYIKIKRIFFDDRDDEEHFVSVIVNDIFGLGVIQNLVNNPQIEEIWVEGTTPIKYKIKGETVESKLSFKSDSAVVSLINKILAPINRQANESNPTVDARLQDGSRVCIVLPPIALNGPSINIRKFKKDKFILDDYVRLNSCSSTMAEFLKNSVKAGLNILVAGGTGSGKTTLLNALSNEIPSDRGIEHIITIEDSAELNFYNTFVSSWETKNKNTEGYGEVDSSQLVKQSLRYAPDRIILGEMRDKVAYDVLQAVNTGHDGTMSTIHCESSAGAVTRFAELASTSGYITTEEAKRDLANSFDLIVYVERFYDDVAKETYRKITQITYVAGSGEQGATKIGKKISKDEKIDPSKVWLQDLYKYDKLKRKFVCTGFVPTELVKKLEEKNYAYPQGIFNKVV